MQAGNRGRPNKEFSLYGRLGMRDKTRTRGIPLQKNWKEALDTP